CANGFAGLDYW
nr:immunoglobulin heavy chain junction region [Macaca mulatta]MOV53493.1 immunoglobulin heavy chain junction region [Macaca mulatta]MOV53528.1 immunoglobulin heavy chain junction region [Macaca mulatta]MOV53630.1 immunoglobulin heavy chain junction region [Macaca mulatta]MOV53672.1 immunoglobulin heavy chain junction region [Macaca mulatta]